VRCIPGWGTFYAFANVERAMNDVGAADDNAFAEFLINEAGVAVVPGSAFGAPGHMRLSFAAADAMLRDALARMQKALARAAGRQRA
jgi:aspartate aminotransferase